MTDYIEFLDDKGILGGRNGHRLNQCTECNEVFKSLPDEPMDMCMGCCLKVNKEEKELYDY